MTLSWSAVVDPTTDFGKRFYRTGNITTGDTLAWVTENGARRLIEKADHAEARRWFEDQVGKPAPVKAEGFQPQPGDPLKLFDFNGIKVRMHVDEDGVEWFSAPDVCGAIGLNSHNVSTHARKLDKDEFKIIPWEQVVSPVSETGYKLYRTKTKG